VVEKCREKFRITGIRDEGRTRDVTNKEECYSLNHDIRCFELRNSDENRTEHRSSYARQKLLNNKAA
jgi:hypothetical protein